MANSSDPADRIRAMTDDQRRSFLMWLAGDRPELPAWLELWQASLQRLADRQAPPEDAVRAPDASAAAAAAEVPDELAPPGWTTTPGGYQVPADLDDDPALWTGEDRSPEGGAS